MSISIRLAWLLSSRAVGGNPTFLPRRHFRPTEIISSDYCRVSDSRRFFDLPEALCGLHREGFRHGSYDELLELLGVLGDAVKADGEGVGVTQATASAVGAAGVAALSDAAVLVATGGARHAEPAETLTAIEQRLGMVGRYVAAYRRYCWPTDGLTGLKLAPFHLLASEGTDWLISNRRRPFRLSSRWTSWLVTARD